MVATDTKTEVLVYLFSKAGIPIGDEAPGLVVDIAQGASNLQKGDQVVLSIESQAVGRLLGQEWVHDHSPACHGMHISVLGTDVHVEDLALTREPQLGGVALNVESVESESIAGLKEDWEWVV